ncbi:MAG: DUF6318 family protein [Glutamicibacter sp.]|uniref:DUF6318 family protein n=2 Tax=unclassified Glutamicibacter TaxID=2627139 RepID=UPI0011424602|nr:DUF6318 family protein [Glutamicibacter sp. BW80]
MNTRKIAVAQSVVLACALTVTACAGGASPPDPSESSSPVVQESKTTTPSPSPAKPEYEPATAKGPAKNVPKPQMPELAKKQNEEGAIAFVKYYFDLVNYSLETHTVDDITKITMRSCKVCGDNLIDPVSSRAKLKYWQVGGQYDADVESVKKTSSTEAILSFSATAEKTEIYSAPSELVARGTASEEPITGITVLRWDDGWKMFDLKFSE